MRNVWYLSVLLILPTCETATSGAPGVLIDTLGGVVTVHNGEEGIWEPGEEWRIEEQLRIGSAEGEGPDIFGRIHGVSIGPDGLTYVLDGQAGDVRVFDREGELVRRFGGQGEGPGELMSPSGLAWDADERLWIPEYRNDRYTVFDSDGTYVKTVPRQIQPWGSPQLWGPGEGGWFLDELGTPPRDGRVLKGFARIDTTGMPLDTMLFFGDEITTEIQKRFRFPRDLSPFVTIPVFSLSQKGLVWFATSDEYRLFKLDMGGDTVRIVETAHRNAVLSPEEEGQINTLLTENDLGRTDFPLARQVIRKLHLLEDGHLLVQVEDETSEVGEENWGSVFDVFDPEGRFLGTIETGFVVDGEVAPDSQGDEIVFVTRDELDITYAVRVSIHRNSR